MQCWWLDRIFSCQPVVKNEENSGERLYTECSAYMGQTPGRTEEQHKQVFFLDSYLHYWKFVNFSLKFTLKLLFFSDEVNSILNCIPNHSSIDTKLQFLKQFIPDILKLNPGSLAVVASWTLATVRLLELERKDWPENGLKFAQEVICCL